MILASFALAAPAANRCVTPSGRVVYTDATCESIGAKLEREVTREISVVPLPPAAAPPGAKARAAAARETQPPGRPFQKSPDSPVLTVCYEPANQRKEVSKDEVEAAIRAAVALWNAGCNVTYEFLGTCAADPGRHDRAIDYRVWWASWDDSLRVRGDASKTVREHAIAAASPRVGVALNRDVEAAAFLRQWRRSIAHEFGHVVGIGHSSNRADLMFSGGLQQTPTANDLAACNKAVEARFGVR